VGAALVQAQIASIQPFTDGNGRLCRLASAVFLQSRGVLPIPVLPMTASLGAARAEYSAALYGVQWYGDWERWRSSLRNG
jgi:Fic family protein